MLLRNIDAEAGLCNGVRAIVMRALPLVLDVLLLSGSQAGSRVYLPRMVLAPKNPDLPFVLRRRQFPVKLAWCMTFNKAQGQSLKQASLFLSTPVFSHGQLYVGLSRAGSSKSVKVLVEDHESQGYYVGQAGVPDGVYTDNVVWKEALLHDDGATPIPVEGETLPPQDSSLGDSVREKPETLFLESTMGEECFDVVSDPPQTLRTGDPEETGVHLLTALDTEDSVFDLTTSEDLLLESPNDGAAALSDELSGVMQYLAERAQFYGVGPSEWYEVSRRTLPEIIAYIETLQLVSSRCGSSSG